MVVDSGCIGAHRTSVGARPGSEHSPVRDPDSGHGRGTGQLFVCGTPIGNLEDVTLRLLRTLREVSLIAAEDTRHTRKLLNHFDIDTPLISVHEHNERARIDELLQYLKNGESVALVSDAGMPTISDPGGELIKAAVNEGIPLVVVPGPTAAVTALVGSGLATDRFVFEGFMPRRTRHRREYLRALADEPRTLVFYEAPHRLRPTLRDMLDILGDRQACVARELTKAFEQWQRGPLSELLSYWEEHNPRGEFVIVVEGVPSSSERTPVSSAVATPMSGTAKDVTGKAVVGEPLSDEQLVVRVQQRMAAGIDKKTAVRMVAEELGVPRRTVYRAAVAIDVAPRRSGAVDD